MAKFNLYGGDVTLEFNEGKHVYTVNGQKIPSVTGITGVIDKPALAPWFGKMCGLWVENNQDRITDLLTEHGVDEIKLKAFIKDMKAHPRTASREAADIGTLVHQFAEEWGLGLEPEMPANPLARTAAEAFLDWAREHKVKILEAEFKVYSKTYHYAGTCDLDAEIDGARCIVDYKTSSGIWPEYAFQVAAYQHARQEELGIAYDRRWIVRFPKDGKGFEAKPLDDFEADFDAFLGALKLYRRLKAA